MKIRIYWAVWTGYMDICARALKAASGAKIEVVLHGFDESAPYDAGHFFSWADGVYRASVLEENPDFIGDVPDLSIICSWNFPLYRRAARIAAAGGGVTVMCMDNQWKGTPRQFLGLAYSRLILRRFMHFAAVPGPRQRRFAELLGFSGAIIEPHIVCDTALFAPIAAERWQRARSRTQPGRTIIFVGRMVEEKAIDQMMAGWALFHAQRPDWKLIVCGTGPFEFCLEGVDGVDHRGFVQPGDLPSVMLEADALLLSSKFEAWSATMQEAACAGLAILATRACGATDAFLKDGVNGFLIDQPKATDVADALLRYANLTIGQQDSFSYESATLGLSRTPEDWAASMINAFRHRKSLGQPAWEAA
jgi:glycosyltransferase involved in cell wall biosynthesis